MTEIAVVQSGIFSYQCDGDRLKEAVLLHGEALPFDLCDLSAGD
jgi:hypothetical protein